MGYLRPGRAKEPDGMALRALVVSLAKAHLPNLAQPVAQLTLPWPAMTTAIAIAAKAVIDFATTFGTHVSVISRNRSAHLFFSGNPLRFVEAKSCNVLWGNLASDLLRLYSFAGLCSAKANRRC